MARIKRKWKICICVGIALVLIGLRVLQVFFLAGQSTLTISKETTRVTEPVNDDGTINYVAALNERYSKGVTFENNAAVLLIRAAGPALIREEVRERTLLALQIESLPDDGDYFVLLDEFVKASAPAGGHSGPEDTASAEVPGGTVALPEELRGVVGPRIIAQLKGLQVLQALMGPAPSSAQVQAEEDLERAVERPWSREEYPLLSKWLRTSEKALAIVSAASNRQRYFVPLVSESDPPQVIDTAWVEYRILREMGKSLVARAMLKVCSGDIEGAHSDLMIVHRLARLAGHGPEVVDRVIAIRLEALACSGGCALAGSEKLTTAQAQEFLADLEALSPLPGIVETLDASERFMALDAVMMVYRYGPASGVNKITGGELTRTMSRQDLDWDWMLRTLNGWYDREVAAGRKETFAERMKAYARTGVEAERWIAKVIKETKGLGLVKNRVEALLLGSNVARQPKSKTLTRLLFVVSFPRTEGARVHHDRARMELRLARVTMALAAYRAEQGEYPSGLSDLEPKYFQSVPKDLFVDEPLTYRRDREGYVLYSVGSNMIDDGGEGQNADHGDQVVRVPARRVTSGASRP